MSVNTSYTPMTLTSKGLALQSKVMAGTTLNLLRAVIGEGYLQEGQSPLELTELVAEVPSHQYTVEADTAMVDFERHYKGDDNITYATIRVTNGDTQFFLREIGLIALDPDEGEILYAYVNFGDYASNIMAFNGVAHIARHFNFPILVRNTTSFEVNITYPAEVTYEEFEAHKSNTDNPHTIEFTEAETLLNITSGERLSLIFGKIKKAIASLISHLADESNPHNVTVEQIGAIPMSAKGSAGGVAELDESGTVPSSQLPSYVDDVIECNGISAFPTTGESGKIYVDILSNLSYRWSGSRYTEISKSLAIGTTSSTAFAGDKGQTAYEHSQQPHAPSNAEPHRAPTSAEVTSALGFAPAKISHSHNVNDITSYFTLSGSLAVVSAYGYTTLYHGMFSSWTEGESHLVSDMQTTFGAATFGKSVGTPNNGFGNSTRVYVKLYVKDGVVLWDEYYNSLPSDVPPDEVTDIGSFAITNTPYTDGCITVDYSSNPQYDEDLTLAEAIIKLAYEIHKLNAQTAS